MVGVRHVIPLNATEIGLGVACEPYIINEIQNCMKNKALYVNTCEIAPMMAKHVFITIFLMFLAYFAYKHWWNNKTKVEK